MQAIGPNQERWLRALESGEYQQGDEFLCRENRYCCLGVACEVFGLEKTPTGDAIAFARALQFAPESVVRDLALYGDNGRLAPNVAFRHGKHSNLSLAGANDDGATFAEIAAFCRANPAAVFRRPA